MPALPGFFRGYRVVCRQGELEAKPPQDLVDHAEAKSGLECGTTSKERFDESHFLEGKMLSAKWAGKGWKGSGW